MSQSKLPLVHLRALEPEDLNVLYDVENDRAVWGISNTNVPYSRSALIDYITSTKSDIYSDRQVRLMAENDLHEVVGIVDIVNYDPQHARAEVGIVVRNQYRRQGYATAIMDAIMAYGKKIIHLHQFYAIIAENNIECLKLFEKLGFQGDRLLTGWLFDGEKYYDAYLKQKFL